MTQQIRKICGIILVLLAGIFELHAAPYDNSGTETDISNLISQANKGDVDAMFQLGQAYFLGKGVGTDIKEAGKWYTMAAKKGNPKAMAALGGFISRKYIAGTAEDAFKWFKKSAAKGYDFGIYNLGYCYEKGYGVKSDLKKAYECYRQAADMGNVAAMNSVGIAYLKGRGIDIDTKKAFAYFLKSAESDNPAAYANVARCYVLGDGCEVNFEEAMKWYEKAAEYGDYTTQFLCGGVYYAGNSRLFTALNTEIDYAKAVKYLKMTIENSRTTDDVKGEAYRMLSACYRFGRGVEPDEKEADRLVQIAAGCGELDAKKLMDYFNTVR